jgi:uncharacterized membrane protein
LYSFFISLLKKERIRKQIEGNIFLILLAGFSMAMASTFIIGLAITKQIVPYVIAIKRTSILFSVLYGMLIFKEKNILQRLIATFIMFAGILLIILF